MCFSFFEVGGKVRDELLGVKSKDVDYVAVPNEFLLTQHTEAEEMFQVLIDFLTFEQFKLFLITRDCFTIRAMFPAGHKYSGVADFVMARKEIGYVEGTRTPIVKPGTLYDDLQRRDFTVNAMAKGEDGEIIDFFNGKQDLKDKILKTPLECEVTFNDDPLRILRAIRFSITKGFKIPAHMAIVMDRYPYTNRMSVVSDERIKDELHMCFKHDTFETMRVLNEFPTLRGYIFTKTKIWLKPTMNHES